MKPILLILLVSLCPFLSRAQFIPGPGEYVTLGLNTATHTAYNLNSAVPYVMSGTPANVSQVCGGAHHAFVIDNNGRGWGIDDNSDGELGIGNTTGQGSFVEVTTDTLGSLIDPWAQIVCSATGYSPWWSTSGVTTTGKLYVWGNTQGGNEGNGTPGCAASKRPVQVIFPAGTFITKVQPGYTIIALDSSGNVWTWGGGGNTYWLGQGNSPTWMTPHKLNLGGGRAVDIAGGAWWNYALLSTGHIWGWGGQWYGDYLGVAPSGTVTTSAADLTTYLNLESQPKKIWVNNESTYVLLADSTLWAWGGNACGTIGNGQEINWSLPGNGPYVWDQGSHEFQVLHPSQIAPGKHNFINLWSGSGNNLVYFAYAMDANNQLYAWGRNKSSAIDNGIIDANPSNGNISASYPNSWDVPWPAPVNPMGVTTAIQSTSPYCIGSPSGSPCNIYAIPANTAPRAVITATQYGSNAIILNGSGSSDNVFIAYYLHTQTAGTPLLMGIQAAPNDTIYNVSPGTYSFKLRVIDNGWMKDSAFVTITIGAQKPIADAGPNILVVYPTTSASLNGTGSTDTSGGTIMSYTWTKVSGPAQVTMSNMNTATPSISNLTIGTYVFQLTVQDNLGDTASSQVQVLSTAILPIEFDEFSGQNESNINYLTWTASADNGSYNVERSTDGKTFTDIASIAAQQDNSATHSYSYADATAPDGVSYYRLENISESGFSMYSKIIEIKKNQQSASFSYYPNPVQDNITMQLQSSDIGPVTIRLISVDGRVVLQQQDYKAGAAYTKQLNFGNVPRGLYFISLNVGDTDHNLGKIVKE